MADEEWVGTDRFAHQIGATSPIVPADAPAPFDPDEAKPAGPKGMHKNFADGQARRAKILELVTTGKLIKDCVSEAGVSLRTYYGYRSRFPQWAAKLDEAKQFANEAANADGWNGTTAAFMSQYFGMNMTWFQLMFLSELEKCPPGNIIMALWPPEHGKTTTFENYANMKLALKPGHRFLVASENQGIAKKINGRIMDRMHSLGPFPAYVAQFGPFVPQTGQGISQIRQPWTANMFRVYKARTADERNYSMEAVGVNGSIVSARTDHFHVDDAQSTKTLGRSETITTWLRQDGLSRPAETGITSIVGTRVGDGDFFEELLNDNDLDGIMKVIRFPAIITDNETGEQKPLWEGKHTLDTLDRMRRKAGQEIWDRNWMQNPGVSRKGKGTFTTEMVERCHDPERSLEHHVGDNGERANSIVYIGLDPALGGKNCITAWEVTEDGKMILRKVREDIGFERNEQIMSALESVVRWCNMTGMVTDVVVEDKNFQLGLKNDERMEEMSDRHGFQIRGHMTGWNKYDPDIGVASMATSFIKREIVLPWKDDDITRHEVGEMKRQLYAWKPGVKGNKLRQDRVMSLWFVWALWRSRHKSLYGVGSANTDAWKRQTTDWTMNDRGLIIPQGAA